MTDTNGGDIEVTTDVEEHKLTPTTQRVLEGMSTDGEWLTVSEIQGRVAVLTGGVPARETVRNGLDRLTAAGLVEHREERVGAGALRHKWRAA